MLLLAKITFIVTLLFIWFDTNSIFYYYHLLTGKNLNIPSDQTIPEYIYNSNRESTRLKRFLSKLVSCYKCVSLWFACLISPDEMLCVVYISSLLLYRVLVLLCRE